MDCRRIADGLGCAAPFFPSEQAQGGILILGAFPLVPVENWGVCLPVGDQMSSIVFLFSAFFG